MFKHLSIAQQLFLLWFCCFDFVYSSLSRSAGFIFCCLNLFPTTVIPQHKRIKKTTSQWKTQFVHLGHESITREALLNIFCSQVFRGASSGLKDVLCLTCLFPWQRQFGFPTRRAHSAFVVHVLVGMSPVTFMGGFLKQCFDRHGWL